MAAKKACTEGIYLSLKIPLSDLHQAIRVINRDNWKSQYSSSSTGKWFKCIHPFPPISSWFKDLNKSKKFISVINRIRCNHGMHKAHLHKIKLADDSFCDCRETMTLEHLILECPLHNTHRNTLLNSLYAITPKITLPFNLITILIHNNLKIFDAIYEFITKSKIKI